MAIKTLKGMKRKAIRQQLVDQGYNVYRHHYSRNDIDILLHIAAHRLTQATNEDFYKVFHRLTVELSRVRRYTRVKDESEKGQIINERVICLTHGNPETEQHNNATDQDPMPPDKHE